MEELIDKQTITLLISQLGLPMVTEVIDIFVPDASHNIQFLCDNWHIGQHLELRIKSHSLKSSAANIGFKRLSRLAESLEEHCLNYAHHEFDLNKDKLNDLSSILQASIEELALMGISQTKL